MRIWENADFHAVTSTGVVGSGETGEVVLLETRAQNLFYVRGALLYSL